MLPDFPVQKAFIVTTLQNALWRKIHKDQLLSMIHVHRMHEGNTIEIDSPGGFHDHVDLIENGTESQVTRDEIINEGIDAYFKRLDDLASKFIEGQHKVLFNKVDDITAKTNMTVDARGKPFSPEMLLEALEKIELSFTDNGQPLMPTIVMHPKLIASIKEKMPTFDEDPEFKRRMQEIIEKKRKEWHDRENSRKLVD